MICCVPIANVAELEVRDVSIQGSATNLEQRVAVRDHRARWITWSIDRLAGTRFPFSRQVMTLSPYSHRRFAVARLTPNSQQIGFQAVRFARNQTSLASCGSSQRNQSNAASASVMARGPGCGPRVLSISMQYWL